MLTPPRQCRVLLQNGMHTTMGELSPLFPFLSFVSDTGFSFDVFEACAQVEKDALRSDGAASG